MEVSMKVAVLFSALVLASSSLLTLPAAAATHRHQSISLRLANGRTVTMRLARYHGTMMAMMPAIDLSDVFHRPH
jgi:hypothetical protein